MTHWTVDDGSVFILGKTQTGKTTAAREIHAETDRVSVWVNERGDKRVRNVSGNRYESVDGVVTGMARDERTFNLLSSDPATDIPELQDRMWEWAERTNRSLRMQIVVDELHRHAPQSNKTDLEPRDSIREIAKEGQKRRVKLLGITQDPVSADKQTLRQSDWVLLFQNHFTQEDSLRNLNLPFDRAQRTEQYHAVLVDDRGEVVETVKPNSKYTE